MIRLEVPWLPPSSNHAYENMRGGGRRLSTEGKKFLRETKAHLAQTYPSDLRYFRKNKPYLIVFRFHFAEFYNKTFATGKAESRYKRFDGGNRTKLLEDALKDVGNVDDSQTVTSTWQKVHDADERTIIWAWDLEQEETPFDALLHSLQ